MPTKKKPIIQKDIDKLAHQIHIDNEAKGFYDTHRTQLEFHALITTEIAEMTEAVRDNKPEIYLRQASDGQEVELENSTMDKVFSIRSWINNPMLKHFKPEGEAVECADAIIRLLDYAAYQQWPIADIIALKLAYNKTRSHRHGDKSK